MREGQARPRSRGQAPRGGHRHGPRGCWVTGPHRRFWRRIESLISAAFGLRRTRPVPWARRPHEAPGDSRGGANTLSFSTHSLHVSCRGVGTLRCVQEKSGAAARGRTSPRRRDSAHVLSPRKRPVEADRGKTTTASNVSRVTCLRSASCRVFRT